MKNPITPALFALSCLLLLSGCASSYRPISAPTINYNSHDFQDGIELSYKYDVLRERGNRKYSKKEDKKGLRLVAVKLTNSSNSIVTVGQDVAFFSGMNQINPVEPMVIKETIKQVVPGYIPYILLSLVNVTYIETVDGMITKRKVYPVGLILGPALTLGNMLTAGSANKKMLNELVNFNLIGRDIQPGETVYGIIGIRDMGYSPITVKRIN